MKAFRIVVTVVALGAFVGAYHEAGPWTVTLLAMLFVRVWLTESLLAELTRLTGTITHRLRGLA